ncbi:MAG: hypothetical protein IT450_18170 [Phycisphaerales bacterium]|nr:hypothetical protein [Phycisphaerales bacterium]
MTQTIHYRPVKEIRTLEPRIRVIYSEPPKSPAARYLESLDQAIAVTQPASRSEFLGNIAATVLGNQQAQQEAKAHHLAGLIEERIALGRRQMDDIHAEIDELRTRIPLRPRCPGSYPDGSLTEAERRIQDLERQKRALELTLWRDTVELRTGVLTERIEQHAMERRLSLLSGGPLGGQ